jgi:hypothetical protein
MHFVNDPLGCCRSFQERPAGHAAQDEDGQMVARQMVANS